MVIGVEWVVDSEWWVDQSSVVLKDAQCRDHESSIFSSPFSFLGMCCR